MVTSTDLHRGGGGMCLLEYPLVLGYNASLYTDCTPEFVSNYRLVSTINGMTMVLELSFGGVRAIK